MNADELNWLRDYLKSHPQDGSCPFNSMNEEKCHEYEDCTLCIFDHAVEEYDRRAHVETPNFAEGY